MRRKLLILNIALAGAVIYGGVRFREAWQAARARDRATLNRRVAPVPSPKFTPSPIDPPVVPSGYADIANKMLFDKSRNSVVIEVVAPPPPPPPMPPLPAYHGAMNLGDSPTYFFSFGAGTHQATHIGEMIGQFKLVSVNTEEITFEWNGKPVRKSIEELSGMAKVMAAEEADSRSAVAAPAGPAAPPPPARTGPGEDTGRGFRACSPNDGVAEGSVVDGYRKVGYATPFGQACRYEPVK